MRRLLAVVVCVLGLAVAADTFAKGSAKDDKKAPAKKGASGPQLKHPKGAHLDYKRTYLAALTEARIRNLPVFVSRHKDF
ncbi:MAG: hypothetical protein QNJ90_16190 [Planctomycetota bacterium]|nr:hypothetical protein [Planctomycetota bacterium]